MKCLYCGQDNEENIKYCTKCGRPLKYINNNDKYISNKYNIDLKYTSLDIDNIINMRISEELQKIQIIKK